MANKLRVGIIGCGDMSRNHAFGYLRADRYEIVALADPDEEGRQKAIDRTGAKKGYSDYVEMLKTEQPDIAVVATHEMSNHLKMIIDQSYGKIHNQIWVEEPDV